VLDSGLNILARRVFEEHLQVLESGSVFCLVRYAYLTAFSAINKSTANVEAQLQLNGQFFHLKRLRHDSDVRPLIRAERRWDLQCKLYAPVGSRAIYEPLVFIRTGSVNLTGRCTLAFFDHEEDSIFRVTIQSEMKTCVYANHGGDGHARTPHDHPTSNDTMQSVMDAALAETIRSIQKKHFTTAEAVLTTLRDACMRSLRQSSLAKLLDFIHIQTEVAGLWRKRIVDNTWLNSDGTIKGHQHDKSVAASNPRALVTVPCVVSVVNTTSRAL